MKNYWLNKKEREFDMEILGAIARGYCHDKNLNKVLDADLCFAIAVEIVKLFKEKQK